MADNILRRLNRTIYIHDEVSEQLEKDRKDLAPRFAMLCRQLGVNEWIRFKPTKGDNVGWRRSPLGGNNGSHYYMWWLIAGAGPGKQLELEQQDIAIRSIRHHDLTDKKLGHGDLDDYWEFKFAEELDDEQVLEQPWTLDQQVYIEQKEDCQVLIGPPGSGKTSSLWRALEIALLESRTMSSSQQEARALYITWSTRLAESAEQYFSIMAPKEVQVYDLTSLLSKILSGDLERLGIQSSRQRFQKHIENMKSKYALKKKALERIDHYYDLIRAWIIGRAPWQMKRVGAEKTSDEQDRLIQSELQEALRLYEALQLSKEQINEIFPELAAAQQISLSTIDLDCSKQNSPTKYDFVVVDEVQDLTPLELQAALNIAQALSSQHPRLFIAGDEGQVVRPTFFQFSELNDLLFERGYHPQSTTLASNLRCPKVIADTVTRAKAFNRLLPTKYRPSDQALRASSYDTEALVALAHFKEHNECRDLIESLALNPNVYFIELFEDESRFKKDLGDLGELRKLFNTSEMVKGLEFASVCIVGASALIRSLNVKRAKQDPIAFRLDVNRLRVAMSRAVEHLIFIEPMSMVNEALRELIGGQAISDHWQNSLSFQELQHSDLSAGLCLKMSALDEILSAQDLSVDERVQGFIKRIERLFFDEQRAMEAYDDLLAALYLSEESGELSLDLSDALNELCARITFSETLRLPSKRTLSNDHLMASTIRQAIRSTGSESLLKLMNALLQWSQHTHVDSKYLGQDDDLQEHSHVKEDQTDSKRSGYEELQMVYSLFCDQNIQNLSWLTRLINDQKWRLFEDLLQVSRAKNLELEKIEAVLSFMGFDQEDAQVLALRFRRQAFDHLIDSHWQRATVVWQAITSQAHEDLVRTAKLFLAQGEPLKAAQLYETLDLTDEAFKAYRQAGAFDEAGKLIEGLSLEDLEESAITSLELITVMSHYLKRFPLSQAEQSYFYQFGDQDIALIQAELKTQKAQLNDRIKQVNEDYEFLKLEQQKLAYDAQELKQAQCRVEAKEGELKRRSKDLRKGLQEVKEATEHLSGDDPLLNVLEVNEVGVESSKHENLNKGSKQQLAQLVSLTETLDALPALGHNNIYEAELYSREQELIQRAQDISVRELAIRKQNNRLQLIKERLNQAQMHLEQEQTRLLAQQGQLQERAQSLTQREISFDHLEVTQKQAQDDLKERLNRQQQEEYKLHESLSQLTLEQERLESTRLKSLKAQQKSEDAQQRNQRYAEELQQREDRLERKTQELAARLKEFEDREARWEEEAHALSSFYPVLSHQEDADHLPQSVKSISSSIIQEPDQAQSIQAIQAFDDWQPRYTSTSIRVFNAEMTVGPAPLKPELSESLPNLPTASNSDLQSDLDDVSAVYNDQLENDTELDLKPIIDEDALPLPHWFEDQSTRKSMIYQAGKVVVDQVESIPLAMIYCPAGSFVMGSNRGEPSERPCHQVDITRAVFMAQSLVTQRLWALVMGFSPSRFIDPERPVERITWHESVQFCNRLSALNGLKLAYQIFADGQIQINFEANGYRLPTEAEWEYVARAGDDYLFAGSQRALDVAWSSRSARGETKAVMQKAPNAWGLYDMCGNVAEWCADVSSSYENRPRLTLDPFFNADHGDRVIRGGAWSCSAYLCRVTSRGSAPIDARGPDIGLRICRRSN